jgi:hypothetical protein
VDRHASENAIVYLDDSHFPVLISTWVGTTSLETASAYVEWVVVRIERAQEEGVRVYSICDSSLAGRPDATVRKYFAEQISGERGEQLMREQTSIVVHSSPFMRGALTAIGWAAPSMKHVKVTGTIDNAFRVAQDLISESGGSRPDLPIGSFRSPAEDDPEAWKLLGTG